MFGLMLFAAYALFTLTRGVDQRAEIITSQDAIQKRLAHVENTLPAIKSDIQTTKEIVQVSHDSVAAPSVLVVKRPRSDQETPSPAPAPPPVVPESVPVIGPRSGVLIGMSVDKKQASPGDTLTYHIAMKNAGKNNVNANVSSHIPTGTVFLSSDTCPPGRVVDTCLLKRGERGQAGQHQITYSRSLPAGKTDVFTFDVQIAPHGPGEAGSPGTSITDHAHFRSPNAPAVTSEEVHTNVGFTPSQPASKENR